MPPPLPEVRDTELEMGWLVSTWAEEQGRFWASCFPFHYIVCDITFLKKIMLFHPSNKEIENVSHSMEGEMPLADAQPLQQCTWLNTPHSFPWAPAPEGLPQLGPSQRYVPGDHSTTKLHFLGLNSRISTLLSEFQLSGVNSSLARSCFQLHADVKGRVSAVLYYSPQTEQLSWTLGLLTCWELGGIPPEPRGCPSPWRHPGTPHASSLSGSSTAGKGFGCDSFIAIKTQQVLEESSNVCEITCPKSWQRQLIFPVLQEVMQSSD